MRPMPSPTLALIAALAVGCSSSSPNGGVNAVSGDASAGDGAAVDAGGSGDGGGDAATGCAYTGPFDGGAFGNLSTLSIPDVCKGSSGYDPSAPGGGYGEDVTEATCGSMTVLHLSLGVDANDTAYYDTATGALLGVSGAANTALTCVAYVPGFQVPTSSCTQPRQLCPRDGGWPTDAEAGAPDAGGD